MSLLDTLVDQDEQPIDRAKAHVGLVCTQALELKPLLGRLDRKRRYADGNMRFIGGFLGETIRVAVVESGAGFAAHRHATETLLEEHSPKWIISTGFSSSLSDNVPAGDLSLATEISDTHGQRLTIQCPIPESKHATLGCHVVADHHPADPARKQELAANFTAAAVDTGSLAVAQVCTEASTPFLSIRAVVDAFQEQMPATAVQQLFAPEESRHGAAGRLLTRWRLPREVRPWMERAGTVSDRLDRFLQGVICQLGEQLERP